MKLSFTKSLIAAGLLAVAAAAPAAAQDGRVRVGMLMCNGPGQTSFIVGSVTTMSCVFKPDGGGRPENYAARITRVGVDIGVTTENALAWAVWAPTRKIGPGELTGKFGGVAAGAAIVVGGTANVLLGGSNNSVALQPLSLQGSRGANVVAGVAGMDLDAVRPGRRAKKKKM